MIIERLKNELVEIESKHLYRELKDVSISGKYIFHNGNKLLNLSSNDYLGYFQDNRVIDASIKATEKYGTSSTSSRLVCGNLELYSKVEEQIREAKYTESALLFNSGYNANLGILDALSTSSTYILADELIHASIIDAIKLSGSRFSRFAHNSVEDLEKKLSKLDREKYSEVIICIESIYSMDGDIAPISNMKNIANRYNAIFFVDEAHSTGVYGKNGSGLCGDIIDENTIIMGTLGKGLGNFGAYFAGSEVIKNYLINRSRSLIYTTALPPAVLGGISKVFELLKEEKRGEELLEKCHYFRNALDKLGLKTVTSNSPIIPIILGDNKTTLRVRDKLYDMGYFTVAIREPTVPKNSSRLRITLSNSLDYNDLDNTLAALKRVYNG